MKRRHFLAFGVAAGLSPRAFAQPAKGTWKVGYISMSSPAGDRHLVAELRARPQTKVYRIGYLSIRPALVDQDESFARGLRELGYVEGRDMFVEWRFFKDKAESLRSLAKQLVAANVECIVTVGISATRAAKEATSTVPIVMANASDDPVRHGLVATLARPGGNVTGFIDISSDLTGKRLQVLKTLAPRATRIAVLWDPGTPVGAAEFRAAGEAAPALGLELFSLPVRRSEDFDEAFRGAAEARAQALYVAAFGGLFHTHRSRVLDWAAKSALPAIYTLPEWAAAGGLMSYAADVNDQHRRAATYVDRILKGSKPADLPVQQPTKFELIVNLKTAARIGVAVPAALLAQADKTLR
jgi:putative tryptophan/tyrosine transport system substrate-binding protein